MFHNAAFTASVRPIFDAAQQEIPAHIARGVYRDDTDELISTCGPNFTPVQHMDVIAPVMEHLQAKGYEVQERVADTRALYDLRGQKGAFVETFLTDKGAKMRTEIILGDFIDPTGSSSYLTQGADTNFFRITLLNSHDSSLAVRANTSYLRLVCMNGMTQPHFTAGTYGKHTKGFNLAAMQRKIDNAMTMMSEDEVRFAHMARTKISFDQAMQMIQMTIAKQGVDVHGNPKFSERLTDNIMQRFLKEDQTVWGLYNAVTEWQTHGERKAGASAFGTRLNRETRVAAMLKTDAWQEVMAA